MVQNLYPKAFFKKKPSLINIRGVSEKYPTCVHISPLVLFFVIRTVASFEVVPIWLNHTLPAVLPHLKAVLQRRFWNSLQLARRSTLNRLDVVEPLSFERHFQFWEHPKVAGSYVGTVQKLAKLYNVVFRQKLLRKVRWMRWRVIVVKKPVTAWLKTRSFSSHGITQSFQNFNITFFVDRLTSWSKFVVYNTLTTEKNNQHRLDMAPTLTCFFRPWLVWTLPPWRLLFSFRIVTINPWFITSNNLLKDIFIITDHFQVVVSDFRATVFLLGREQFRNEFRTHASHS